MKNWIKRSKKKAVLVAAVTAPAVRSRPEVTGVMLLLLGFFFLLSLVTYRGLGSDSLPHGANLMGSAGRYAAFAALQILGLACGYYVALSLAFGVIWLTQTRNDVTTGVTLAYLLVGLLLAALFHLGVPDGVMFGGHLVGGAAGELIGTALGSLFSAWGGRLVALALAGLLVLVATPTALKEFLWRIGRAVRAAARGIRGAASWALRTWRSARRTDEKAEQAEEAEQAASAAAAARSRAAVEVAAVAAMDARPATPPAPPPVISRRAGVAAAPARADAAAGASTGAAAGVGPTREVAAMLSSLDEEQIERAFEAARAAGFLDPSVALPPPSPPRPSAAGVPAGEPAGSARHEAAGAAGAPPPAIVVAPARRRPAPRRQARPEARPALSPAEYRFPSLDLLVDPPPAAESVGEQILRDYAAKLAKTLGDYGIEGNVVEIHPGPVVTTYEFRPAPGTKLSRISSLESDIAMALAVMKVRIVAPIPGKNAVGFEVPNPVRETVYLKELIADQAFARRGGALPIAIGKDLTGKPYYSDLARMPHLLVAGATGTGKSVFVNATLVSLLFRQSPDEMRLLLIDPKHVELIAYDRIPHLLLPVVSDMRKAALALRWAVDEMERRYHLFAHVGARQLTHYNLKIAARAAGKEQEAAGKAAAPAQHKVRIVVKGPDGIATEVRPDPAAALPDDRPLEKMSTIVIVIDELAELMSVAAKDVESAIQRLAQKGRAAGIHLIVATQRPSVDVITGTIKANFPTRASFKVSSKTDSRTVLDQNGADQLLGLGDMLLLPPGASDLLRIQGALVTEDEIERVVAHIRVQGEPTYDESIVAERDGEGGEDDAEDDAYDEHWEPALELVLRLKQASISKIQRHLRIGYNRAARLVERMEREGLVGPGDNPREKQIYPPKIMERLESGRSRPDDEPDRPGLGA